MTRINLATDLKTRTGAPDKDARLKNAYVEVRGESSAVRRRPSAQGGVAVGSGTAQGGIGFNIAGTDYFIGVWGDTITPYTGGGTTWNSGTAYSIGDHVSVGFEDYWALTDNTGSQPPSSDWSAGYVPAVPFSGTYATWDQSGTGSGVQLSNGNLTVSLGGEFVKSTISKITGKHYWELHIDSIQIDVAIGIGARSSSGVDPTYTVGWTSLGEHESWKILNGNAQVYGDLYGAGDIVGVALDLDIGTIEYFLNGVSQGVAYSNLKVLAPSGPWFAFLDESYGAGFNCTLTANFGASPFAYPVPNGYNPGLYTP